MAYRPSPSVTTLRVLSIRAGLAASTVTPGRTAPDVSFTTPAMVLCAAPMAGKSISTATPMPRRANVTGLMRLSLSGRKNALPDQKPAEPSDEAPTSGTLRRYRIAVKNSSLCRRRCGPLVQFDVRAPRIVDERQRRAGLRILRIGPIQLDAVRFELLAERFQILDV